MSTIKLTGKNVIDGKYFIDMIKWITANWNKIPGEFKTNIAGPMVGKNERTVVLLIDRQKPSIDASYDFDEERIGITEQGKVVWGFDSGCSCPTPWEDSDAYNVSPTWKEFIVNIDSFDVDVLKECLEQFKLIKKITKQWKKNS